MPNKEVLQVRRMIKEDRAFEDRIGFDRIIEGARLPQTIRVRHWLKVYNYTLHYGEIDDRVYVSYSEDTLTYKQPEKVLMHYEEATMRDCMVKAWRHLAENRIKVNNA